MRTGPAKITCESAKIETHYINDKLHGPTKIAFNDGTTFQGNFKEGVLSGKGTQQWKSGRRIEGEWKDGQLNGEVEFTDLHGNQQRKLCDENGNI